MPEVAWDLVHISKDEAKAVLEAAAFERRRIDEEALYELAEKVRALDDAVSWDEDDRRALVALAEKGYPDPEKILHNFAGPLGVDGLLEDALAFVDESDEIAWTTHLLRHDLAVRVGDRVKHYDVKRPERSAK